ncbi:MAG: hypothetical protein L6V82_00395 [Clostridiales bacterium]|nr:MAG: hypothetical protein L6V82_00395 [Clostridiales bacterium]
MKRKTRRSVYDAIAQLNRLDIDTPISIEGDVFERRIFKQLETLRRSMRDARDKNKADDEKRKVMIASVAHDLKRPLPLFPVTPKVCRTVWTIRIIPRLFFKKPRK